MPRLCPAPAAEPPAASTTPLHRHHSLDTSRLQPVPARDNPKKKQETKAKTEPKTREHFLGHAVTRRPRNCDGGTAPVARARRLPANPASSRAGGWLGRRFHAAAGVQPPVQARRGSIGILPPGEKMHSLAPVGFGRVRSSVAFSRSGICNPPGDRASRTPRTPRPAPCVALPALLYHVTGAVP